MVVVVVVAFVVVVDVEDLVVQSPHKAGQTLAWIELELSHFATLAAVGRQYSDPPGSTTSPGHICGTRIVVMLVTVRVVRVEVIVEVIGQASHVNWHADCISLMLQNFF